MKAFPWSIDNGDSVRGGNGMDLRDYFAAKALNGMISSKNWFSGTNWESVESMANMYSHEAYAFADAMMKVREQEENNHEVIAEALAKLKEKK